MSLRAVGVIVAVALLFSLVPHAGRPWVDMAWRAALLTAIYWPVVHFLRIAPELGGQAAKLVRHSGGLFTRN
jgi:hypothetical protein